MLQVTDVISIPVKLDVRFSRHMGAAPPRSSDYEQLRTVLSLEAEVGTVASWVLLC